MSYPQDEWSNYNEDDYAQETIAYDYESVPDTYDDYLQPTASYTTGSMSAAPLDAQFPSYYSSTSPGNVQTTEPASYYADYSQQQYASSLATPSTGYASTSGYDVAYDYRDLGADQAAGYMTGYPPAKTAQDYHIVSQIFPTEEASRPSGSSSRKHSDSGKQPQQHNKMRSTKSSSGHPPKSQLSVFPSNPEPKAQRKQRKSFDEKEKKKVEAVRSIGACPQCKARKRTVSIQFSDCWKINTDEWKVRCYETMSAMR